MSDSAKRELRILIDERIAKELEALSEEMGFPDLAKYVEHILTEYVSKRGAPPPEPSFEKLRSRLERYIQDEINKRFSVIENVRNQVVTLFEKVEELENRVNAIEAEMKKSLAERPAAPARAKRSAMEILKEQKVTFESSLSPAIKDRNSFIERLEKMGAVVLRLSKERVLVDPDFWREFKEKITTISTNREDELKRLLEPQAYNLWKALYADGLLIFDGKLKKWKFVSSDLP